MAISLIDSRLRQELSALYRKPGRHYHGLHHINALLALHASYSSLMADPAAIEAAIWFHDAVYDSRATDNEARSAALAHEKLAGLASDSRIEHIVAMIEATATHQIPVMSSDEARQDAALFLDMDLAILGAEPDVFSAYEANVRCEYDWVDAPAWHAGRKAVLQRFLDRKAIFHTEIFRARFEQAARENITRSLAELA